jgi:hypothetical protein
VVAACSQVRGSADRLSSCRRRPTRGQTSRQYLRIDIRRLRTTTRFESGDRENAQTIPVLSDPHHTARSDETVLLFPRRFFLYASPLMRIVPGTLKPKDDGDIKTPLWPFWSRNLNRDNGVKGPGGALVRLTARSVEGSGRLKHLRATFLTRAQGLHDVRRDRWHTERSPWSLHIRALRPKARTGHNATIESRCSGRGGRHFEAEGVYAAEEVRAEG